ncbi:MAG: tyrosine-type recombinase/integrase [Thermoplasmata archaeon]|nr:tyrosine-type recombinase/integrase [Thermoplasmata archaeon]
MLQKRDRRITFTARNVSTLPALGGRRTDYRDALTPGFTLRVSPTGARSFAIVYRHGARVRRLTLGDLDAFRDLAQARELARAKLRQAAHGDDPQDAKRAAVRGKTFADLCARFQAEVIPSFRPATRVGWSRYLEREIVPAFGPRKPEEISRADVRAFVREFQRRGSPISGNRAYEVLRRVFRWAVEEEITSHNPCPLVTTNLLANEAEREAVFTDEQLRAVFTAAEGMTVEPFFRLIAYTAARSGEVRSAQWSEIDFDQKLWTIPGEKAKNGKAHPIPLSSGAVALLTARRTVAGPVFPADSAEGYMQKPNRAAQRLSKATGFPVRPHDLRRTVATRLAEMKIAPIVIELILGHELPELQRTYNVYGYLPEMRAALEAWAVRLDRILSGQSQGADVVPMVRP